ncbi:hypothetical protein KUCAC02_007019, partial [Chaenocephalus aceratus]
QRLSFPRHRGGIDSQVHSVLCHVFSAVPLCALSDLEALLITKFISVTPPASEGFVERESSG